MNLSLKLTKIARDHWKDGTEKLKWNLEVLKAQLSPSTTPEELKYIEPLIDKYEEEVTHGLLQKTAKKTVQKQNQVEGKEEETTA